MSNLYSKWQKSEQGTFSGVYLVHRKQPDRLVNASDTEIPNAYNDFQCSDRVIMPQNVFREVNRLRLDFPLLLELSPIAIGSTSARTRCGGKRKIICGVLEFSAPSDRVIVPDQIFNFLFPKPIGSKVPEHDYNSSIRIRSTSLRILTLFERNSIPKGKSCKIQPLSSEFLDMLMNSGLNVIELMEGVLKKYSILAMNQKLLVNCFGETYALKIVQLGGSFDEHIYRSDAQIVSLLGDVDLEISFGPPSDSVVPTVGRIRPMSAKSHMTPPSPVRDHISEASAAHENDNNCIEISRSIIPTAGRDRVLKFSRRRNLQRFDGNGRLPNSERTQNTSDNIGNEDKENSSSINKLSSNISADNTTINREEIRRKRMQLFARFTASKG